MTRTARRRPRAIHCPTSPPLPRGPTMTPRIRRPLLLLVPVLLLPAAGLCGEKKGDELFKAKALTEEKSFTAGIEGPACDTRGNVYAVNFQKQGTIGRVAPDGKGEVWVELP